MIEIGFRLFALPTARLAAGRPIAAASSPYERVTPYGMRSSACQTRRWKPLPSGASGRSNTVRSPAKYARSCAAARASTGVVRSGASASGTGGAGS